MKFSELKECPFCGYDVYYSKVYVTGNVYRNERFDGKDTNNDAMYDGLQNIRNTGKCYCCRCNEYLGNVYNNTVGYKAEKVKEKKK